MAKIHLVQDPEVRNLGLLLNYLAKKRNPFASGKVLRIERAKYVNYDEGTLNNYLVTYRSHCSFDLNSLLAFFEDFKKEMETLPDNSNPGMDMIKLFEGFKLRIETRIKENKLLLPEFSGANRNRGKSQDLINITNNNTADLTNFINTSWYCFELKGTKISRNILDFKELNTVTNTCKVLLRTSEEGMSEWYGEAKLLKSGSGNTLIAILDKNVNGKDSMPYTHFAIMVDERVGELEMCVGHKTFIHTDNGNVVTKTCIIQKVGNGESVFPEELEQKKADHVLQVFFELRFLNRLSSPHTKSIYNYKTLKEWIEQNKFKSAVDTSIIGNYKLSYRERNIDEKIIQHYIMIEKNHRGNLKAVYKESNEDGLMWLGEVRENEKCDTLFTILEGPFKSGTTERKGDKPMVLLINFPFETAKNIDTLTGVIAGIRDGNKGTVARLTTLTKIQNDDTENVIVETLKAFFNKYSESSRVRPPHDSLIYNFENLKEILDTESTN